METTYPYSITKDFPNQSVNIDTLTVEISTNSTIQVVLSYISIAGDTVKIVFVDALSGLEVEALDGVVSEHQGNALVAKMQWKEVLAEQGTTSGIWQNVVQLVTEPIPSGSYLLSWYCEVKLDFISDESEVALRMLSGEDELGYSSWIGDVYTAVSGWAPYVAKSGDAPILALDFRIVGGGGNLAHIRRARIALIPVGGN